MRAGREAPDAIERRYLAACARPSDINEHLPRLRELASDCEHVTEFGLRWASGSTVAFLAAQPATFIAWDLEPRFVVSQAVADLVAEAEGGKTRFEPRVGDTRLITIEPTELLFIDTYHVAAQLKVELERHHRSVARYLVFHDTDTFGDVGEDGSTPGLRAVIRWFQRERTFPLWKLVDDRRYNNGLVVLEHI